MLETKKNKTGAFLGLIAAAVVLALVVVLENTLPSCLLYTSDAADE